MSINENGSIFAGVDEEIAAARASKPSDRSSIFAGVDEEIAAARASKPSDRFSIFAGVEKEIAETRKFKPSDFDVAYPGAGNGDLNAMFEGVSDIGESKKYVK